MQILLFFATILILWLVLGWFLKVAAVTIKNGVLIIGILLLLYFVFKISPGQVWEQIQQLFQGNWQPRR